MANLEEPKLGDHEPAEPAPSKNTVLIAFWAIFLPEYLIFRHFGKGNIGLNIAVVLGVCLIAIWIRWDLTRRIWFWVVIAAVLLLHAPLFLLIRWPHVWVPGIALLPIGLADLFVVLGAIRLVEQFMVKDRSNSIISA